jgi:hypothetical protein
VIHICLLLVFKIFIFINFKTPLQFMLDVLGHTYLTSQGAKHNDIEQIAGYASPSTLALYRNVKQQKNI